jgi:L-lactate dehydrogenase
MRRAIEAALERVRSQPVVVGTIANSSHIGCLQAYLPSITRHGLMAILSATNPGIASVAPFGGIDPVLTTNPIAFGIPTADAPILVDVSTSLVTNAAVNTRQQAGAAFDTECLLDNQGMPSTDPAVLSARPPGTILPIGGVEFGHKGFGLGIVVEALSLALSGGGRALAPDAFGQGVFLQIIDPRHLGSGLDYFLRETSELAARCRASRVPDGRPPVRLPGERSLRDRDRRLQDGVPIAATVQERLAAPARAAGIDVPHRLDRRRQ